MDFKDNRIRYAGYVKLSLCSKFKLLLTKYYFSLYCNSSNVPISFIRFFFSYRFSWHVPFPILRWCQVTFRRRNFRIYGHVIELHRLSLSSIWLSEKREVRGMFVIRLIPSLASLSLLFYIISIRGCTCGCACIYACMSWYPILLLRENFFCCWVRLVYLAYRLKY